jgi:hypothetical protein
MVSVHFFNFLEIAHIFPKDEEGVVGNKEKSLKIPKG